MCWFTIMCPICLIPSRHYIVAVGRMHRINQNIAVYYPPADEFAQNDDSASAATERVTEDEYADSATHSHGSHGMASKPEQPHKAHNHFAAQDKSEEDHTETSSEGTR